tara:strand:+ start:129 stop:359 length:231 start_codon:yes stop_codon:yes gene_type:complete
MSHLSGVFRFDSDVLSLPALHYADTETSQYTVGIALFDGCARCASFVTNMRVMFLHRRIGSVDGVALNQSNQLVEY